MTHLNLREFPWRHRYSWEVSNPVKDFYVPALSRSVLYQRKAGYFSSTVLAVAAQGIARLITNGGRMQLLVGCQLSPEDVQAIQEGYDLKEKVTQNLLDRFNQPVDRIMKDRLAALAYMVAKGTLEIKVALPTDGNGRVVSSDGDEGIFHEKVGIFTDALGQKLAFSGSINETKQGWLKNRESFHVFKSWSQDAEHLAEEEEEFGLLWQGAGRFTLVIDFPQAVERALLNYKPDGKPCQDPMEDNEPEEERKGNPGFLWQFIKDAPYLKNGHALAESFSTVDPWPHQRQVVNKVFANYTGRFLLSDEVGLGKTIEAGLVIKKLLLTGLVRRCLILTPKSVLRQWQEELREKFNLQIPRYEQNVFWDVRGKQVNVPQGNPWDRVDVALASCQLMKREDRWNELLTARDWDLIILDEAHNARRSGVSNKHSDRNKLLQLMDQLERKTKGLLLLSATPMQLDPVELWDLLVILGMGGLWGARAEDFTKYFLEVRKMPEVEQIDFLVRMLKDYRRLAEQEGEPLQLPGNDKLGLITRRKLESLIQSNVPNLEYKSLHAADKEILAKILSSNTPIKYFMLRNTRNVLRFYKKKGWLDQNIPERDVKDVFIDLDSVDEKPLYDRIEEYISKYYKKALEEKRSGLGFIMTIYRRRLTSSFYAITKSLERRLAFLRGDHQATQEWLDELDDLFDDERQELNEDSKRLLAQVENADEEIEFLENFLFDLQSCSKDSKYAQLDNHLRDYLNRHSKVIIFTQYTDTMKYLREQLQTYRNRLACYSGDGGEYWDGQGWRLTTKEDIKEKFSIGQYQILLCTDAASEGLNLQTCGLLINYDMPWNPMRVEQRIGRIDRIGQQFKTVEILNYFYKGTVEETIYQRLSDRIGWFNQVVGELQPILSLGSLAAKIPLAIKKVAMSGGEEKESVLAEVVADLLEEVEKAKDNAVNLDAYVQQLSVLPEKTRPPVTTQELERVFTTGSMPEGVTLQPGQEKDIYLLTIRNQSHKITFNPKVFDRRPDSVKLLAYGEPLFDQLLEDISLGMSVPQSVVRIEVDQEPPIVGYFYQDEANQWQEISNASEFQEVVNRGARLEITDEQREELKNLLLLTRARKFQLAAQMPEKRRQERLAAVQEKARQILYKLLCYEAVRQDTFNVVKILEPRIKKGDIRYCPLLKLAKLSPANIKLNAAEVARYKGAKPETLAAKTGALYVESENLIKEYKYLTDRTTK
ncbi:MAG: helicase-related protein [Bacillota bacterium]